MKERRTKLRIFILSFVALFFVLVGLFNILATILSGTAQVVPSQTDASVLESASGITPSRLTIPALGVDAEVEHVGVNARGTMAVPSNYKNVAWYKSGTLPGDTGNAVIAGHLDNSLGLPGVFENLHRLRIGDTLRVRDANGITASFRVREMTIYATDDAPEEKVFGNAGKANLVLITCNGAWDHARKTYDKRLVVIAELVS